ncbi:MAG: leucine-rich repeat domain-containing protein [Clostridia bacterium]|nr:leucine-rich repeat domain-containing protein [Clostridia bacterium]
MKRKILIAILAVVAVITCVFGLTACRHKGNGGNNRGEINDVLVDGLILQYNGNGYTVKKVFDNRLTTAKIPDKYRRKPVTAIETEAFAGCFLLESVNIGDNITSIGMGAFRHCSALTSIKIPDSVTSIGNSAFMGCSALTSITIPDGVTEISDGLFSGCNALKEIVIPDSITKIGNSAFWCCFSLTDITLPDGLTVIGEEAFSSCTSLRNLVMPDSVTTIGERAFKDCHSLKYNEDIIAYYLGNNVNPFVVLVKVNSKGIIRCTLSEKTKIIYINAFYGCSSLESITIPDSVTIIESGAFRFCRSLTDIYFNGTKEQWGAISKSEDWDYGTYTYTVHCTDGDI